MHLRRRQPDAVILVHRLDHVVDELLHERIAERRLVERPRARAEHRVPHPRHFENRTSRELYRVLRPAGAFRMRSGTHDERPYSYCPIVRRRVSRLGRLAAERAWTARLRPLRVHLLPRPEGRRRHDHPRRADHLLFLRRAIEPGYGLWVFPGGYVDRGEEVYAAALREAREEAGLEIRLDYLINVYSYPSRAPVIIVYAATVVGGCLRATTRASRRGSSRPRKSRGILAFGTTSAARSPAARGTQALLHATADL